MRSFKVALILVVLASILGLAAPALFAGQETGRKTTTHIVAPGETLWQIALEYAPERDPRRFIYEIQLANGLEGASILPGQKLILPAA